MLLFQMEFLAFLSIVLGTLYIVRKNEYRKVILLVASYYFYAFSDYRFLTLIIISTMTDYSVGRALSKTERQNRRRLLLLISLIVNLSILGFFKYYNFFIASFINAFGISNTNHYILHLVLPLGISYYTFQTLSYTIDVFNRKIEACDSILDYALFVAFFPSILAGPIVRASRLLPQLRQDNALNLECIGQGIRVFIIGLFLKVFIADRLGMFVDVVFESPGVFNSSTVWLAVCSYTLQIYLDFAGYSNMAIGVAKMLGYDIGINFNFPYLSKSIAEFWKRWHISLSSWIMDYIYIPLGGSRKGESRAYANLLFVMLLCGLWHGATWTFVLWGGYHGVALGVRRLWSHSQMELPSLVSWALTMIVVSVGWIFFRSSDLNHAILILRQLFLPEPGVNWTFPFAVFAILATSIVHILELYSRFDVHRLPSHAWYTPALLFSMLWLVVIFRPKGFRPFMYLNF